MTQRRKTPRVKTPAKSQRLFILNPHIEGSRISVELNTLRNWPAVSRIKRLVLLAHHRYERVRIPDPKNPMGRLETVAFSSRV
jgi:hypothetical protein